MTSIKKQNLYLIYISKYLQHFNLNVHHKSKKQHIILNALSRLVLIMSSDTSMKKNELDALFMKTYVKMLNEFQKCFIKDYDEDSA